MQAWQVNSVEGIEALKQLELPDEPLGEYGVRVRIRAASLNYRDLAIVAGGYYRNDTLPVIPLSDAAGEVLEIGSLVTRWQPGDRVCPIFLQDWIDGQPSDAILRSCLGGSIDGVLAERRVFPEHGLVRIPDYLSDAEAATLPCAALTAWHALFVSGEIQAGQTVLLLGTGGVSIFALQLAKAAGARVIITSSSESKLKQARELGADETINYREIPAWSEEVQRLTNSEGADQVVEVGGPGTLEESLKAARIGGRVHLIGILEQPQAKISPLISLFNCLRIQGIYVGSRSMFEQMNRALEVNQIRPVIHSRFPFAEASAAYQALTTQQHVGKIVIEFP